MSLRQDIYVSYILYQLRMDLLFNHQISIFALVALIVVVAFLVVLNIYAHTKPVNLETHLQAFHLCLCFAEITL